MAVLTISNFGGGVVLEGSADVQRTDELLLADSVDIGERGQLVAASDFSNAFNLGASTNISNFGIIQVPQGSFLIFERDSAGTITLSKTNVDGSAQLDSIIGGPPIADSPATTFASLPYVGPDGKQKRVVFICLGSRPGLSPAANKGLIVLIFDPAGPSYSFHAISDYDFLGTGPDGEFAGGTSSVMAFPRGVITYNQFAFIWGFDHNDSVGLDGPNKLMFSNIANPLKWGNDPDAAGILDGTVTPTDRTFNDTDAFVIGGLGTAIRAGCVWNLKLWLGSNQGLYYVEGFGRDSFLANGGLPVAESRSVLGPYCLIEGPDGLLHGVDDVGHWVFNGQVTQTPGMKLRDYKRKSNGYWDLIWSDPSSGGGYPGKTNQDLVWMMSIPDLMQVWIGIPYCSISNGYGVGADTVIIKYNCRTGGYTRQTFAGKIITAAHLYKRDAFGVVQTLATVPGAGNNVQRYGYQANGGSTPIMPGTLPDMVMGEYAPSGPVAVSINRRLYLTLSWESGALPLVFTITPAIDQEAVAASITLTITAAGAPGSPADGDIWVDTSGTDANLGNGTAGAFTPAHPGDYIVRRWVASWAKWIYPASGGAQGTRMTIPIAFIAGRGTRLKYEIHCTAAAGRFQIETLGIEPATISETI